MSEAVIAVAPGTSKLEENKPTEKISSPLIKVHPNKIDRVNLEPTPEKYECMSPKVGPEKENKVKSRKKLKLKKRPNSPDPIIISISDMMSTSLKIVSPDKLISNEDPTTSKKSTSVQLGKNIDAQLDKSIEEIRLKTSPSGKRKSSSPKQPKSKFKECSQQTKLSGFIQVKSSSKEIKINGENKIEVIMPESNKTAENIKFKLSNNLFKSPRRAIKKNSQSKLSCDEGRSEKNVNEKNCDSPKLSKNSENSLTPTNIKENCSKLFNSNVEKEDFLEKKYSDEDNFEIGQGNLVGKSTPKKIRKAKKKRLSLIKNDEDIEVIPPCKESTTESQTKKISPVKDNSCNSSKSDQSDFKSKQNNCSPSTIEQNYSKDGKVSLENQETSRQEENSSSLEYSKPYQSIINENSSSQSLHSLYTDELSKSSLFPLTEEVSSNSIHTIDTSSSLEVLPEPTSPQKNVFRFMMEARHKSIGMNIDGKILENVCEEPIEEVKVSLKTRKERLEEWNKSKGAIKRKLEEAAREEFVSAALDKRAKKLKKMLSIGESKKRKLESSHSESSSGSVEVTSPKSKRIRKSPVIIEETVDVETFKKVKNIDTNSKAQSGLLSFFGVLSDKNVEDVNNGNKFQSKKLDVLKTNNKSPDMINDRNLVNSQKNGKLEETSVVPLKKKRGRPRKILQENKIEISPIKQSMLELQTNGDSGKSEDSQESSRKNEVEDTIPLTVQELYEDSSDFYIVTKKKAIVLEDSNTGFKLLNEDSITGFKILNEDSKDSITSVDSVKSKKNAKGTKTKTEKKGISLSLKKKKNQVKLDSKNSEDSVDLTDDVECVPITPRRSSRAKTSKIYIDDDSNESEKKKKIVKKEKVAPVFTKMVRPKIDPAVLKARKDFLYSGVPSVLKRMIEKQESINNEEFDVFPVISHVQQKPEIPSRFWNLPKVDLKLKDREEGVLKVENLNWNAMVHVKTCDRNIELDVPQRPILSKKILEEMKSVNPDYPVYKMFRLLREKSGYKAEIKRVSPRKKKRVRQKKSLTETKIVETAKSENTSNFAMWTEKYKPKSSEDIIGNVKCLKELKGWLDTWLEFTKEIKGRIRKHGEDSSDFETDGESRDSLRLPGNCMLLKGPPGSGKTSAIYAICNELGINVIELNASSKRTGKRLLQELQEATQSHQVRKTDNNYLSGFFQQQFETQIEKPKEKNKMCLLLVEDVDIVFDQDEGFISGLIQLLTTSKRPIVLISGNIFSNNLQKFLHYPTLEFQPLPSESLSTWLQLLCLNEGLHISKSSLSELLNSNKGDMRKTLLQLQFWTKTGGDSKNKKQFKYLRDSPKEITNFNNYLYKDDSSLNLVDQDLECRLHEDCVHSFIDFCDSPLSFPVDLGQFWWNLPEILPKPSSEPDGDIEKLSNIFKLSDALSFSDVLYRGEEVPIKTELCPKRWKLSPKDSLSLKEDFSSFRPSTEITYQISHSLINGYSKLEKNDPQIRINLAVPTIEQKRWITNRFDCEEVFNEAVSISSLMDRKSYSVDYFPTLRQICRTEAKRSSVNNKRNNRFYNYVKTLNVNPAANTIATACGILSNK